MKTIKTLGAALAALALVAAAHAGPTYRFVDLGNPGGPSFYGSYGLGINNVGQVVGQSLTSSGSAYLPILWNGPNATDLGTLGGTSGYARSINIAGQVVGYSDLGSVLGETHATLWNGTVATDLGTLPNGGNSYAMSINNAGQVVGWSVTTSGYERATLWQGNTVTDLGTLPGGRKSYATGINNAGQVAGYSTLPGDAGYPLYNTHAVRWDGATLTDLGTIGGHSSQGLAINDVGQVVGMGTTADNRNWHAIIWNGTTATDLGTTGRDSVAYGINNAGQVVGADDFDGNPNDRSQSATLWSGTSAIDLNTFLDADTVNAGWFLQEAYAINDNGWITGRALNLSGVVEGHAFLLIPVPEPETYAMMLAGLGLVGAMARRRKLARV